MAERESIGYYDPDTAKQVLDHVRQAQHDGVATKKGVKPPSKPPARPIFVKNDSGEEIPAFACIQAVGTVLEGDQCFLLVKKPADEHGAAGPYLFNLFHAITTDQPYGVATDGPHVNALVSSTPVVPEAGAALKPTKDAWLLQAGPGGYQMIGPNDGANLGDDVFRVLGVHSVDISRLADVHIRSCVKYADTTLTVYFGTGASLDWQVDGTTIPEGATENPPDSGSYELTVDNPYRLTAVASEVAPAVVRIGRNLSSDLVSANWELVEVGEDVQIARWCKTQDPQNGALQGATFWEGADPYVDCPPSVTCAFDCSCLDSGDYGIGFYVPESDTYMIISTDSALMGPPDPITAVTSISAESNCGMGYANQPFQAFKCGAPAGSGSVTPSLTAVQVVEGVVLGGPGDDCGTGLSVTYGTVYVCDHDPPLTPDQISYDICDYICRCCDWVKYSEPDLCDPPPPILCNCEDCHFEEGPVFLSVTDGPGGLNAGGTESTMLSSGCIWEMPVTGTGVTGTETATITYVGDGIWNVTVPNWLPGGVAKTWAGTGDCSGANLEETTGPGTGRVNADGVACVACDCCEGCGATYDEPQCLKLTSLTGSYDDDEDACAQLNMALRTDPPIDPADLYFNGCSITVPVTVAQNGVPGSQVEGTADISLQDGKWTVVVTHDVADCPGSFTGELMMPADPCDMGGPISLQIVPDLPTLNGQIDLFVERDPVGCTPQPVAPVAAVATRTRSSFATQHGLGNLFVQERPDLFKGCGCKNDVIAVMNRWPRTGATSEAVRRVATTIAAKNSEFTTDMVLAIMAAFMEREANTIEGKVSDGQ